jgi:hypothetical protein
MQTAARKNEIYQQTLYQSSLLVSQWTGPSEHESTAPCHFVLSTPSNYKFFQEMARVFLLPQQPRGNFTHIEHKTKKNMLTSEFHFFRITRDRPGFVGLKQAFLGVLTPNVPGVSNL